MFISIPSLSFESSILKYSLLSMIVCQQRLYDLQRYDLHIHLTAVEYYVGLVGGGLPYVRTEDVCC